MTKQLSLFVFACVLATGCGKSGNAFEKAFKPTGKEKAQQYLEQGDCDAAQDELSAYLDDTPSDIEAKQLLYDAVSSCLDLGMDSLISKMGDPSAVGGDMSKLIAMMPEATAENIAKLQKAVDALLSIPASERTSEQNAQLAMASMSVAATTAKMVAANEDGSYNKDKAATMTDAQADSVIQNLQIANEALAASGSSGSQTQSISSASEGVNNSPGSSSSEKLRNYLEKR